MGAVTKMDGTPLDQRKLPHNIDAEQRLLGAFLNENDWFGKVAQGLKAEDFYDPIHQQIFDLMASLIEGGTSVSPVSMKPYVDEFRIGELTGFDYLMRLFEVAPRGNSGLANAIEYAKIVKDTAIQRSIYIIFEEEMVDIERGKPLSAVKRLDRVETLINDLRPPLTTQSGFERFDRAAQRAVDIAARAYQRGGVIAGLSTGLERLDAVLGGLHRGDLIVIAGATSMGKAQPLSAKVLTESGWKKMGDLRVGEPLASVDGQPSKVVGVFPQGRKEIFRITFSDGRSTECCADHLWRVQRQPWKEPRVVSTSRLREMLALPAWKGRIWIEMVTGDFGSDRDLPIDPWALGALLGNGCIVDGTVRFSSVDEETLENLQAAVGDGFIVKKVTGPNYRIIRSDGCHRVGVSGVLPNPLKEALKDLGLWGRDCYEKSVPPQYLNGSRETRLALLQGLMDTDGWSEINGAVRFGTSSLKLAKDVQYLVRSLGGLCAIRKKAPTYTYKGRKIDGSIAYLLKIRHANGQDLFRLSRKADRARRTKNTSVHLKPVSIEIIGEAEAQCIAVSHPSSLYITDDFIVTHNTALGLNIAYAVAQGLLERQQNGEKTGVVAINSLEMPSDQIAQRILAEHTRIPGWRLRQGKVSETEFATFSDAAKSLAALPIEIDATGQIPINQVISRARSLKKRRGIELLVVDYIQLMKGIDRKRDTARYQEVAEITGGLKALAKELDIPIIALSQIARDIDKRPDTRPKLSDLRESASIEMDSDVVMFVHRLAYYLSRSEPKPGTLEHSDWSDAMERAHGWADIIIGKNRHGPIETVSVGFDGMLTRFKDELPEPVQSEPKPEKGAAPKKLSLSKEALISRKVLQNLAITASFENDGHVDAARKGHRLIRYEDWKLRCVGEILGPEANEKNAFDLMKKVCTDLLAPSGGHSSQIGRGGPSYSYVWLTEAGAK